MKYTVRFPYTVWRDFRTEVRKEQGSYRKMNAVMNRLVVEYLEKRKERRQLEIPLELEKIEKQKQYLLQEFEKMSEY